MSRTILYSYALIGLLIIPVHAAQIADQTKTPQAALEEKKNRFADVALIGESLFNPVLPGTTPPKPNPYATTSINETAIDALFAKELSVNATLVTNIKQFYFYLEYIIKLERAGKIATYAQNNNIDVITDLEEHSWKKLIDDVQNKAGDWNKLITALTPLTPNYALIHNTIHAQTWLELVNTDFWKALPITTQDIVSSSFWQKFLKYSTTRLFEQDSSLLGSIVDIEKKIFMYIPNIEVAYYNTDFLYIRNSSEYFRLTLLLTDKIRDRLVSNCLDWKNLVTKDGSPDLPALLKQTEEFKKTSFYQLINLAHQPFTQLVEHAAEKKLNIQNPQYADEPMIQTELTCLAMIKNLQAQLHYLFDATHIQNTMQTLKKSTQQPYPTILWYTPQDEIYLQDMAQVMKRFEEAAPEQTSPPGTAKLALGGKHNPTVIIQDFGSWLSDRWGDIRSTAQKTFSDVAQVGKDTWDIVKDEAKVALEGTAALGALLSGHPADAEQLLKDAVSLQKKVAEELKTAINDADKLMDDAVEMATEVTSIGADLVGTGLAKLTGNQKLADDIDNALKAGAGVLINLFAGMKSDLFALQGAVLYLTVDAIATAADVVTKSIMDVVHGHFGQLGSDILGGLESMVSDVATTLWSTISFVGKYVVEALMDAVKLVGYITTMLTDVVVDASTAVLDEFAGIADSVGWSKAKEALGSASQAIESHRRFIAAVITTNILIGVVIATDGAALPLLAMTVGPQLFQGVGSFQEDERAIQKKADQEQFLKDYQQFIDNNKIIATNTKDAWLNELDLKFKAEITNQERALGFYQNYVATHFEGMKNQMSYYLGGTIAPQLEVQQPYNMRFADIGALYGFSTGDGNKTGILNLNPSQGFSLYSQTRDAFAQEIAVYPALSLQLEDSTLTSDVVRKFWFNQRDTMPLAQEVQEVEIRFQALYVLNTFYIGLYFGGEPLDIETIQKTQKMSIDPAHHAKMLVYKKESAQTPITLHVYEHEGKSWLPVLGPSFESGIWYHMKMNLSDTTLKVKVWQENQQEPGWQSFAVEKTEQKTLGVIYSGASIQYQIITPTIPVTQNIQMRPNPTWSTEEQRAQQAQTIMEQLTNPHIGSFDLVATNLVQVLKKQYLYSPKTTQQLPADDIVALGLQKGSIVDNIGASPREEFFYNNESVMLKDHPDAAIISLVTGNAYSKSGTLITTLPDVLSTYLQKHGPLTTELSQTLDKAYTQQQQRLLGPFTFGSIPLSASSMEDIKKGQFIYTAVSPEPELKSNNKPIINNDKELYDYFMVVNQEGLLGTPYSETAQQIQSLVTGKVYQRGQEQAVESGYEVGSQALDDYAPTLGKRRPELDQAINDAVAFYQQRITQEIAERKPLKIVVKKPTDPSHIEDQKGAHQGQQSNEAKPLPVKPAEKSVEERTKEASQEEYTWG